MDADSKKVIIMMGVFGFCGSVLMIARLVMRKVRGQKFKLSDYLTMVALICVAARTAFTTVIEIWGNNNMETMATDLTSVEVYRREIASKLTLVNRINYNTYIWIQKSIVLLLYRQMLDRVPRPQYIMNFYWGFLGLTYIVVQATTFVDCHPFHLYWQVVPRPGVCAEALIQLIVFVTLNIATDILLIILPMPWIIRMKTELKQRLLLVGLFSIGFLLIGVAIARLPVYGNGTSQVRRNVLGSVEEFSSAVVANVPTLFSLRHKPDASETKSIHSNRHSDMSQLRKTSADGIIVTRCFELQRESTRASSQSRTVDEVDFV